MRAHGGGKGLLLLIFLFVHFALLPRAGRVDYEWCASSTAQHKWQNIFQAPYASGCNRLRGHIRLGLAEVFLESSLRSPVRHGNPASSANLFSTHLDIRKVHLGMLLLELLENIQLLLLVTGWLACLLLSLVIHHLLDHAACLAI